MSAAARSLLLAGLSALAATGCTRSVEAPDAPEEPYVCAEEGGACPDGCTAYEGWPIDHAGMCVHPSTLIGCVGGPHGATGAYTCIEAPDGVQYVSPVGVPALIDNGYGHCEIPSWVESPRDPPHCL